MALKAKMSTPDSTNGFLSFLSEKWFSLFVKVVDKYVPDRFLLFAINFWDNHVPNGMTPSLIKVLVPPKLRSIAITAADKYVPDTVANSRKICAVLAAIGKYIPDKIIPPESAGRWEKLRAKFHVPKLISKRARVSPLS